MCRTTSANPMTASRSVCSMSETPAAAIRDPPIPVSARSGTRAPSSAATPAACRSPDVSPATNNTSRTGRSGECGKRTLDLAHDAERERERFASVFPGHGHRLLAPHRGDEALELEAQRLALRRLERDPLDELLELARRRRERGEIDVVPQAEELTVPAREIQ